ncbi:hypothetical protein Tco_0565071 [Tanacetum coccineum]
MLPCLCSNLGYSSLGYRSGVVDIVTEQSNRQLLERFKYGSSLKTSPLLYPELCHILFEKYSASGSIRRLVAEKRLSSQNSGVKLVEVEDDVNIFNKEGGSLATSEHVNLDAGYDTSFEDGSSKEPNVARGMRKKSKKDSELGELEETIKNAITNIAAQENQGPTMEECHENLKSMRLEPDDSDYLAATDKMLVFSEEVIRPTTFNPNPNIPGNNRRECRMFKGAVGALDGTLIHAYVPSHKQNVYKARGRCDCYQNILAICDFNMIFTYIVAGWEDKYYLWDAAYRHTRGFMAPYRNVSDIHVNENVRDDNDGDVEVAQPIGSEADQQYMINLRDDIATQIMQARMCNLERQVTLEEIKEAVWDCGSSKAPGPDGYSFAFVKKYWGTIQKDLYDFVNLFFASCVMPNGANSSFFNPF